MLDAAITGLLQIATDAGPEIAALDIEKPHVHWSEFQNYKFQIDIDGNSNAWPGFFLKLVSGSPVLKVASSVGFRQWFYDRLVPWFNYVPIEPDMSDLLDKIAWLQARDDLSRYIGRNGQVLAQQMTPETETLWSERAIMDAIVRSR